jgi:hypothetical protein
MRAAGYLFLEGTLTLMLVLTCAGWLGQSPQIALL